MYKQVMLGLALLVGATGVMALVGDSDAGAQKNETCVACHNTDGNSTVGIWPKIAGQHQSYLVKQLLEYQKGPEGDRYEPSMYGMVQGLSEQDIYDLASFYAEQKMTAGITQAQYLERGEQLWRGGDLAKGITACMACHHPQGLGNELANFPRLKGQNAEYTASQLKKYRSGERKNDINGIMRMIAAKMSDEDIEAVSSYAAGLQ